MLGDGTSVVKRLVKGVDIDEEKLSEVIRSPMKAKHKRTSQFCPDTEGEMVDCEVELVLANLCQRFFCFEYLSEGSLYKQITDASHGHEWTRQYQIMKGICDGPCYLNIVQLDLKPTNILLDFNGMPKIVDCGISRCFEKKQSWVITSKFDWNNIDAEQGGYYPDPSYSTLFRIDPEQKGYQKASEYYPELDYFTLEISGSA